MAKRRTVVRWRKSSTSGSTSCVEVAFPATDLVLVRDSKAPEGAVLAFTPDEWDAFIVGVRLGEFDRQG